MTDRENRDPLPGPIQLLLISIISGAIGFTIAVSVDYTPIPLAIAILLLLLTLPAAFGYAKQSFAAAMISGAIPVCLVLWAPYARFPSDISNVWIHVSVFIVGVGVVLPVATVSYVAGLALDDRSALRDQSRYLLVRGSITTLLVLRILVAYLQGLFPSGMVD